MYTRISKILFVGFASLCLVIPGLAFAQKKEPLKIGFIASMTGTFAQIGKDMADGASLYLEEIKHTMAGRRIEFIRD
jgi:branched-chain amino acid transport system substrate-binding protein